MKSFTLQRMWRKITFSIHPLWTLFPLLLLAIPRWKGDTPTETASVWAGKDKCSTTIKAHSPLLGSTIAQACLQEKSPLFDHWLSQAIHPTLKGLPFPTEMIAASLNEELSMVISERCDAGSMDQNACAQWQNGTVHQAIATYLATMTQRGKPWDPFATMLACQHPIVATKTMAVLPKENGAKLFLSGCVGDAEMHRTTIAAHLESTDPFFRLALLESIRNNNMEVDAAIQDLQGSNKR